MDVAAESDDPTIGLVTEQGVENLAGETQLVNGFEQRHESDTGLANHEVDEPCFLREHCRREYVVRSLRHRDDVGLDDVVPVPFMCSLDGLERVVGYEPFGIERRRHRCKRTY